MTARSAYCLRRRAEAFRLAWDTAHQSALRLAAGPIQSRAIHGFVEPIIRHGKVWGERHRFDNRHTMAVLTRLDRSIAANRHDPVEMRIVAENFEEFLDIVGSGDAKAADDFIEARRRDWPRMATMNFATFTPKARPQWQPSTSRLLPFLPGTGRDGQVAMPPRHGCGSRGEPHLLIMRSMVEGPTGVARTQGEGRNGNCQLRDGVDAPRRHRCAKVVVLSDHQREASVGEVSTIGLDIAKQVFQAHGADATGPGGVPQALWCGPRCSSFFAGQPPLSGGAGGLWRGAPLGAGAWQAGPHGAADPAGLREAVRQAAEERRGGCRGDLRSGAAAEDALRAGEGARRSRRTRWCSGPATCWCGSGRSASTPCAGTWPSTAMSCRKGPRTSTAWSRWSRTQRLPLPESARAILQVLIRALEALGGADRGAGW